MLDFLRSPAELHSAPDCILVDGPGSIQRQNRGKRRSVVVATPPLSSAFACAPAGERAKRSKQSAEEQQPHEIYPIAKRIRYDTDDGAPTREVVVPAKPCEYSRELTDDDHELVVVEMKAESTSNREAWLDDETVSDVLLHTASGDQLVRRVNLRAYVMRVVALTIPARTLSRALKKMCLPRGTSGPLVTLLSIEEILEAIPDAVTPFLRPPPSVA